MGDAQEKKTLRRLPVLEASGKGGCGERSCVGGGKKDRVRRDSQNGRDTEELL